MTGHKSFCTCDNCAKQKLAGGTSADLSMFTVDDIERLKTYQARVAKGEFTDWPGELHTLKRDFSK
jgi:hypothetical protein